VRSIRPLQGLISGAVSIFRRRRVAAAIAASSLAVGAGVLGLTAPAFALTAVTGVVVSPSATTVGASATYTISFVATSGLPTGGTIDVNSPSNTIYQTATSDYTINGVAPSAVTPTSSHEVVLTYAGSAIATGGSVTVIALAVTNPTTPSGSEVTTVSTSADMTTVPSAAYTIYPTGVYGVTASVNPLTAGAAANYVVTFTVTTALVVGDTITITAPLGTIFQNSIGYYTVTSGGSSATEPGSVAGGTNAVTLHTPVAALAGAAVQVIAYSVVNPATGTDTLSVSTNKDPAAVASNVYYIGSTQISALQVTSSPAIAGAVATYDISFVTTVAMATSTTVTITAPSGTVFQTGASDYTVQGVPLVVLPRQTSAQTITLTSPVAINAGTVVQVVARGVVNPAASSYTLTAYTSLNTTTATSSLYTIAAATSLSPGTTIPSAPINLAGTDRFGTAIAASQEEFPTADSARSVVIARSDVYADALVGTTLAADENGPLLFANGGSLTAATQAEIQRVLPVGSTVYLLGGESAVPDSVATTLSSLGYPTVRYAGTDRYGTALAVAAALGNPTTVFLATGTNFPDALSAGPAAAHLGGVVLLTNGGSLTSAVQSYLSTYVGTVYAVGGPAAVADPSAIALVGGDRYATAVDVASSIFSAPVSFGVASGTAFPDALSGGAFEARNGGPILLSDPGLLPSETSSYLTDEEGRIVTTTTFGGSSALSSTVQSQIATAVGY
jgi:putative cell wall-binding protein